MWEIAFQLDEVMDGNRNVKNYKNKARLPFSLLMATWSFIFSMSVHAKYQNTHTHTQNYQGWDLEMQLRLIIALGADNASIIERDVYSVKMRKKSNITKYSYSVGKREEMQSS